MKTLDYVKEHINEIEQDNFIDPRFTKRFLDFLPSAEWGKYGFEYVGKGEYTPKEWTEANRQDKSRDRKVTTKFKTRANDRL